jgi:hypothetical protein
MFRTPDGDAAPVVNGAVTPPPTPTTKFDPLVEREKAAMTVWLVLVSEAQTVGCPHKLDGIDGYKVEISLQRVVRDLWPDTWGYKQFSTLYGSVRNQLQNTGRIMKIGCPEKKSKASMWWVCPDWNSNHVYVAGKGLVVPAEVHAVAAADRSPEAREPPPSSAPSISAPSILPSEVEAATSWVDVETNAMRGIAAALAPVNDPEIMRRVLIWAASVFHT